MTVLVNLVSTSDVVEVLSLSSCRPIVWFSIIVLIEVSFQPLTKFEVVLIFCLLKFSNIDVALDSILVESSLEHLIVFNELVLMFGLPLDS